MRKIVLSLAVIASSLLAGDLITFIPGTPAKASEVNANFDELDSRTKNITSLNGNIGIGTSIPNTTLHIVGDDGSVNPFYVTTIETKRTGGDFIKGVRNNGSEAFSINQDGNNNTHMYLYDSDNNLTTLIHSAGNSYFNGGKVGIGITNPNSKLQVNGYIQLAITSGDTPPDSDCDEDTEYGRMKVDEVNDLLYICTQSGWISK